MAVSRVVRALHGGKITIPVEFRRALHIEDGTLLQLSLDNAELCLRPLVVRETAGSPLRDLYEYFAPVRAEILERGISEDELYDDIDRAMQEVRAGGP
jgi:bifunctional DNA-binding transcriptional regulator/antitoxin component of YhaV-PrlF toxin-antitoxin module